LKHRSERKNLTYKELRDELFRKARKTVAIGLCTCLQCGICSASCPPGRIAEFRTRQLIRRTSLGSKVGIKNEDLWLCTTCYTCQERCPKKIEIVSMIIALRNIAAEKGNIIPEHRRVCHMFIRYGHAVPLNDENREKRVRLGLVENPPNAQSVEEALNQLQLLVKKIRFDEKVDFKWDQ